MQRRYGLRNGAEDTCCTLDAHTRCGWRARCGFVAYVLPGSIVRGAVIASKGMDQAQACESYHRADLRSVGSIPPLAGRSPAYIVRELILFQTGGRANAGAAPMRFVASHLTLRDKIAAAAYGGSR